MARTLTVVQMLPALESGGVEKGTLEVGKYLVEHGHRSIVISAGGSMVAQLEREGSTHITLPVGAKRLSTLRHIRPVRELLVRGRVDILHLRSRLPAWIGYRAWKGLPVATRPSLVTTVHGMYTPGWYSSVMVRGERVIAVSETVRTYILRNYPATKPASIRVIPRGIEPGMYMRGFKPSAEWLASWQAQYPQTVGKSMLTLPARLTRLKGHEDFIEILTTLKAQGLPVHGLIVGGAHPDKRAYEQELHAKVNAAGLMTDCTFTGHRSDLREIMSISSVVLSLSFQPESFGRTTLEALALGVPVLGYDHGGVGEQLGELLPEGKVPVGDKVAATARLTAWLDGERPVPRDNPYTLERMLTATLAVYKELCAERAKHV